MKDVYNPLTSLTMDDLVGASEIEQCIEEKRFATRVRVECTSKRRYDKRAAMSILNSKSSRRNKTRFKLRAYQCPQCNFWHIATELEPDDETGRYQQKKYDKKAKRKPDRGVVDFELAS